MAYAKPLMLAGSDAILFLVLLSFTDDAVAYCLSRSDDDNAIA